MTTIQAAKELYEKQSLVLVRRDIAKNKVRKIDEIKTSFIFYEVSHAL